MKKTKIVATLGPASSDKEILRQMFEAGVNVCRLNFSHGAYEDHAAVVKTIRELNEETGLNVAILADLQGPKIRTNEMENNGVELINGSEVLIVTEKVLGTAQKFSINYADLPKDVTPGERILLDDGKLALEVISSDGSKEIKVKVIHGGILSSKKGVNFPNTKISMPSLTSKDLLDLQFALEQDVDWVGLSFVRSARDIIELKHIIAGEKRKAKVIAKIEKPEAIDDIDAIIKESDGLMVARGDLGVELPVEKIPLIQKELIRKCLHRAKPVIVATQMMESMIDRVKPNRSEITDVANAVIEGADAVMLSGETATGQFPVLVIETMRKIIHEVEQNGYKYNRADDFKPQSHSPSFLSDAVCYNGCKLADDSDAKAIIGMTQSGYTAFMLSSFRPKAPLFIFTKEKSLVNQLSLSWGAKTIYYNKEESLDNIIKDQISILKKQGHLQTGDVVVNTGSTPVELHLPTNVIKISKVE
jgi:pyruvate kinase